VAGFDAALPQFEAAGAQVVGVSADASQALAAWKTQNNIKHLQLSDFRRQMLPAYDALVTDEKSPIYRYPKRAYFIIDRQGVVKFAKVMDNPLELLDPQEVLNALKASGV
jgi:glutaredoxin-dependent peroxiredoxin